MKVLLVWNGPATPAEADPLVRRQVPLLTRLAAQGVSTAVVLLGDRGGLGAHLEGAGIAVERLPIALPPEPLSLKNVPVAVLRLRSVVRRENPDVLEGDEPFPAIAVGLAAQIRRRSVVVYRRHHPAGRTGLLLASRIAARLADRTVVSCETMRQCAAEQDGTSLNRIDVASGGVAELTVTSGLDIRSIRQSLGISPGARVVGVVSRLRREKGVDVLLEALELVGELGELHALIIGSGPEETSLRQLAARGRVPVHFLGHQQDVARWLAVADVIAIPSRSESFGRVPLEAMVAGRPLVATRVGGLAEAVADGETGLLVPPDDPASLAQALRLILVDPSVARQMGNAARRRYEARYTIDHMATAWREVWERAVAHNMPPS